MLEALKVWLDRLGEGQVQKIEGSFDPSFLGIEEKELQFPAPVSVRGEVYLAEGHLVIHLNASTSARMPCAICNKMIDAEVKIDNFYHTEAIEEIRDATFDCSEPLREALLLELPHYVECHKGRCPQRAALAPYLRAPSKTDDKTHFPFAGLDDTAREKD